MVKLSVSIVVYNNPLVKLIKAIDSLDIEKNTDITIFDNSDMDKIELSNSNIKIIKSSVNLGFGKAHNEVIFKHSKISKYHLILNPDVYFDPSQLVRLIEYMDKNPEISIAIPKILYPNNKIQYSLRLIPSFFDQFIRRLNVFKNRIRFQELRFTNYDKEMFVPFPLGCFMLCRTEFLKKIGGFDERFFLYMEDLDLCRRMAQLGEIKFFPNAQIFHLYEKGSSKKLKLLKYHIISMIKYYNKWGWIFDKERKKLNDKCLKQFE
jgi:GT2 family glycosyltransferase